MRHDTGSKGEDFVADFLRKKGYKVVARNYKTRFGEIDVIARDAKFLVFTEVKTRDEKSLGHPLEAVTIQKQKKIILAAQSYIQKFGCSLQPRFDVAAVFTKDDRIIGVDYITNAFQIS